MRRMMTFPSKREIIANCRITNKCNTLYFFTKYYLQCIYCPSFFLS